MFVIFVRKLQVNLLRYDGEEVDIPPSHFSRLPNVTETHNNDYTETTWLSK